MKNIKKLLRIILYTAFAIYCLIVVNIVFMRGVRYGYGIFEYIQKTSNFIPFHTIIGYIKSVKYGLATLAFLNIFGNLILFLPMGAFLPCVIPKLNRFWKTLLAILCMVICVEFLQGILRVGCIDIDDVILNIVGAVAGFGIIKIPPLNRLLVRASIIKTAQNKEEVK